MDMQSGRGREYADGILGGTVARYPLAYENQEAYRDGSLGAEPVARGRGMVQPTEYAEGVMTAMQHGQGHRAFQSSLREYQDGVLGALMQQPGAYHDGSLGALMAQPGAYHDGSLGMAQPGAYHDGSLGQDLIMPRGAYHRPHGRTGFSPFHKIGLGPRSPVTSPYRPTATIPKFSPGPPNFPMSGCDSCAGVGDATTDALPWVVGAAAVGVIAYFLLK